MLGTVRLHSTNAEALPGDQRIDIYLQDCRRLTLSEIERYLPSDRRATAGLYELMLEYPLRPAKALRPALCIGTCLALGGHLDAALPSAAAFELFHNAFLVHDDIEDGSLVRRHAPTLHRQYGVPIAVNVGDGMLALSLSPLLDNVRALGLGGGLRILQVFSRMARESVEGQMLELAWIRARRWDIADRDYLRMVHKKTGWYSFIAPVQVGATAARASPRTLAGLSRFAALLGIAFQIQDDLLSLEGAEDIVGKDELGDLWEGKLTLPLLHTLRRLEPAAKAEALAILLRSRPVPDADESAARRTAQAELWTRLAPCLRDLSAADTDLLRKALLTEQDPCKSAEDVTRLAQLVLGRGGESIEHARHIARRHAQRAARVFERDCRELPDSVHKDFLFSLVDFVVARVS